MRAYGRGFTTTITGSAIMRSVEKSVLLVSAWLLPNDAKIFVALPVFFAISKVLCLKQKGINSAWGDKYRKMDTLPYFRCKLTEFARLA